MESFSKVLTQLDLPNEINKKIIWMYNHCINNEQDICEMECIFNNDTKSALREHLTKMPYETSQIIQQLKSVYTIRHAQKFEDIIAITIRTYIELFSEDTQSEIEDSAIYSLISLLELCDDQIFVFNFVLPEIYDLITKGRLNKNIVYLILLPQKNLEILNAFIKYEKLHFNKCDLNDSASLFRYCLYKNRHWLFHIIENDIDTKYLSPDIINKLMLLKLSYFTNIEPSISFKHIENIVSKLSLNSTPDKFMQYYITEIKWNLNLYQYISKLNPKRRKNFKLCNLKTCLETISTFINIKETKYYDEINEILKQHEEYLQKIHEIKNTDTNFENVSEIDLYDGFCILLVIEYYITENKDNSIQERVLKQLRKMKQELLKSSNLDFQLEVFENVFALLFLQNKHLDPDSVEDTRFLCEKKEIYFIATFLKSILKEIKSKYFAGTQKPSLRLANLKNYVADTLWRLELLDFTGNKEKNIINIMLSSPNTLIYLCLENDNFEKAHDVIQMYNMQNTPIAQEIEFIERIQYLKSKEIDTSEIIKFCHECKVTEDEIYKDTLINFNNIEIIKSLSYENEVFMNIIDIAIILNNFELSKELFQAVIEIKNIQNSDSCSYTKFCYNILQIFKELATKESVSTIEILNCIKYPLDLNELQKRQYYYKELEQTYENFNQLRLTESEGKFNNDHICHKKFIKLIKICMNQNTSHLNYLYKLYNYLKLFSNIFFVKSDNSDILSEGKDSCVFDLIDKNPAEITGKLLSTRNLGPNDLEALFQTLKLDIIYHVAWNCLPEIYLQIDQSLTPKITLDKNTFHDFVADLKQIHLQETKTKIDLIKPDKFLLSYIRKRNWLLAYLINKVYLIEEAKPDTNSHRTKYFNNLLNLPSVQGLKKIFSDNNALTVLHNDIPMYILLEYLENNDKSDWKNKLDIINCLPERMIFSNENLIQLRDFIICNLVTSGETVEEWSLVQWINDNKMRTNCILENINNWPGDFCIEILNCELARSNLNSKQKRKLQMWFYQIELYENIKITFEGESWNEIFEKSKEDPKSIFLLLLTSKEILLFLKWIEIHKPKSTHLLYLISTDYLMFILKGDANLSHIKTLLDLLHFDHRIQICKELIKQIKKLDYLEFIINYLVSLLPELESEYKNIMISIQIFSCFRSSEHEYMFCLINKPLLILEQLIMNVRLEKMELVLEKICPLLKDAEEKNITIDITIDTIDNLLRNYAEKSLDFRGIQSATNLRNLELKLMQSLDTVSVDSERKVFVMPEKVPSKNEWISNEQALECMCCQEVTFSMFNRRHHCRRCGRVICCNCSHKKMEIPEYGSIPVRVCDDCHKYSQPEDQSASLKSEYSSSKSGSLNCWLLIDDDKHNDIVREEFSYEYAPSVSLCLSILKLHSNSIEYPRFLLKQCKILLPYLQDAENEIDSSFLIQMIKSLVIIAQITSLHNGFKTELSQCNEIFLYVELLKLLVEKDCLQLLRSINTTKTNDYYINSGVLRRLRDKLLEQEQWPLALEVSTKVGLDKTGVFAAWGKSCLKAGCLQQAREKFQYCLEKNTYQETALDMSISFDPEDRFRSVNLSTVSESKPNKTPPLVNEIISVLESNEKITDRSVFRTFDNSNLNSSTFSLKTVCNQNSDPAVCVLNKLKNLKNIVGPATQNRSRKTSKISIDKTQLKYYIEPCFYNECLYYLMKYGSHLSILQFYIRHDEINDALNYILENRLSGDIFIEIYMKCLEDGKIEILHEHMNKIDSTLNIWEIYLKNICRHLEKNSMFNVLHKLQIFMCDYVRAAMTCIKFYQETANSFRELLDREEFLQTAQGHLKQELEQEQWVQVPATRKTSVTSFGSTQSRRSSQPSLIMKIDPRNIDKYMNTIWRQIEVAKFLAECELHNRPIEILSEIFPHDGDSDSRAVQTVPTLFETQLEKTKLAVLAVVCGKNIEEGFGIAFRIIQDHNLKYLKIYCLAGKYLAQILRDDAVTELIYCIKSSGLNIKIVNETCDKVLMVSISALNKANGTAIQLENLIKLISENSVKIDAYIEIKQLKKAYLLAIKYNKISYITKILREAEIHNQPQIKAICMRRLNQ